LDQRNRKGFLPQRHFSLDKVARKAVAEPQVQVDDVVLGAQVRQLHDAFRRLGRKSDVESRWLPAGPSVGELRQHAEAQLVVGSDGGHAKSKRVGDGHGGGDFMQAVGQGSNVVVAAREKEPVFYYSGTGHEL